MPRVGEMFTGTYLKAADLQGRAVTVTIDAVEKEMLGSGKDAEEKWVVRFTGKEKGLVLNVTNANMIAEIVGDDRSESWPGHEVKLYPSKTDFQGKRVDCIRIDYPKNGKPAPPPVEDVEDTPF